ncbi:MAG: JAB domain-containing protein, partial [Clostridiales bacterium]
VVETAIRHKAKSVVLAHNHPSGSLTPSTHDMDLTWRIIDVMQDISIDVVDHVIVGNGRYLSFAEKGLLLR